MLRLSDPLPLSSKKHIDQVCLRFEAAWQESTHPSIEHHLEDVTEPERSALVAELMLLDLDYRVRAGETPDANEYCARLPGHERIVAKVFQHCGLARAVAGSRIAYFGDYELLEEIARGGMGIVYRARQVSLERIVALKMIRAGRLASREDVDRFYQEARIAAGLQHPNIVAIHEVGEHCDQHYFSMDYVDGQSLAEMVRESPMPARRAAAYVKTVAEAVHFAHQRGTLHRDLKPSNIIIDAADQPRVTDFGLARTMASYSGLTASGDILGTPSYMSPEQAVGNLAAVGPASDVYNLGATLYELLTGGPPFRGETAVDTLRHVLDQEPVAPRRLNPAVPRDLDVICLSCLHKEPRRRYASAQELADDLDRFLRGEPIRARPEGAVARLVRWCRRRPLAAGLIGALILTLLAGTVVSNFYRAKADKRAREATELLRTSYVDQARAWRRTGRPGQRIESLAALASAAAIRPSPELRDEAIACMALVDVRPIRRWTVASTLVGLTDVGMTRYACDDGLGNIRICRVSDDSQLELLKSPDGRPAVVYGRFSTDGHFLLSWHDPWHGQPAECRVWDLVHGRLTLQASAIAGCACDISPNGSEIVVIGPDGTIGVFDPGTGKRLEAIPWDLPDEQIPWWPRFHPHQRLLAAVTRGQQWLHIIDLDARKVVRTVTVPEQIQDIAWHPHKDLLAVACNDWQIRMLATDTGEMGTTFRGHQGEVMGVSFSPSGNLLASRSWDGTGRVWEYSSGRQLLQTDGDFLALEFCSDGRGLVYRTRRGGLGVLEVVGGREYVTLRNPMAEGKPWPISLSFDPQGRWLATSDLTGISLWKARDLQQVAHITLGYATMAAFSPGVPSLFTLGEQGLFRWPIETGPEARSVRIGPAVALSPAPVDKNGEMSLTPDGRYLAATLGGGKATKYSLSTPPHTFLLGDHPEATCVAISPDGRYVATGTWKGTGAKVWDANTGDLVKELIPDGRVIVAFSPDGHWLLTSTTKEYCLWSVGTWSPVFRLAQIDTDRPGAVAFSPDGRLLAVAYTRFAIRLLDPETGDTVAGLEAPDTNHVDCLCFSPDSTRLAVGGANLVRVWNLSKIRQQLAALHLEEDRLPPPPVEAKPRNDSDRVAFVLE